MTTVPGEELSVSGTGEGGMTIQLYRGQQLAGETEYAKPVTLGPAKPGPTLHQDSQDPPGEDQESLPQHRQVPSIDETGRRRFVARQAAPVAQAAQVVAGQGPAGLGFQGQGTARPVQDHVHLVAAVITPEEETRCLVTVYPVLEQFGDDEGLEDLAAKGVDQEVVRLADAEEIAEEAGIQEVQLRTPGQAVVEAAMVGPQPDAEEARLQDIEPAAGGAVADAAVAGEGGQVQQLPVAPGAEAQEAPEQLEVGHVQDVPHVPLDVGPEVVLVPAPRARRRWWTGG